VRVSRPIHITDAVETLRNTSPLKNIFAFGKENDRFLTVSEDGVVQTWVL
jgi:hypothetical protein